MFESPHATNVCRVSTFQWLTPPVSRDPDALVNTSGLERVLTNRRGQPLKGGHSTKICGMWTLKHEIRSPKFYELLIKTELKGDTAMHLNNFYNHINICINAVTRLVEYLFPIYQYIKRYSEF